MQISIIGAGGYAGKELIQLLSNHSDLDLVHITSDKFAGKNLSQIFPNLKSREDLTFQKHDSNIPRHSLVVLAVPNGAALELAPKLLDAGHKVIDLSGAYRLHDKERFEKYYKLSHSHWDLMDRVVFGIPEIFREKLQGADFVSNPGCYSTASILPLFFLGELREKIQGPIFIDAKSGVSGAGGRTEDDGFSYTNVYENFRAYKVWKHQHEPEIQEYASHGLPTEKKVYFTPHLLPLFRGILSNVYFTLEGISKDEILNRLKSATASESFLRILDTPEEIELSQVQHSNQVFISAEVRDSQIVLVSALDNLQKGASGQALQNINLMCGFSETKGLIPEKLL